MEIPDHPYLRLILDGDAARVVDAHSHALDATAEDDRWGGYARYLIADYLGARDILGRSIGRGYEAARIELSTVYRHLGEAALAQMAVDALDRRHLNPFDRALAEREASMLLIGQGRLVEAITLLEQTWISVQNGPGALKVSTGLALGIAQSQAGQDLRAVHVLNAAVTLSSGVKQGQPLAVRGLSRAYSGDYCGAERDLTEARKVLADVPMLSATLSYNEGVLRRAQGRYGEALANFMQATQLAGPEAELSFFAELGVCTVQTALGNLNRAASALARARAGKHETRKELFWKWRAAVLAEAKGNSQTAQLQEIQQAFSDLGLARETGWVWLHLAESAFRADDPQTAVDALEQATDLRHHLGSGASLSIELRDLPLVQEWLSRQPTSYPYSLFSDWQHTDGCAPVQITLLTLGTTQILADGRSVPMRLRRSAEVISYLLDHGPATREQVLTALWPEAAPKESANYFHQVKNKMEAALPGLTIPYEAATGTYSVNLQGPRLRWDALDVKRLLSSDDDDLIWQGIGAYTGAFLPQADVPWAQEARRALEWTVVKSGLKLLDRWYAEGHISKCLELALKLRELEPYNEVLAEYLVITTLELEGHLAARRTFDDLTNQFEIELGKIPCRFSTLEQRLSLVS